MNRNLDNIPSDARCVIFSKLSNIKEIRNTIKAFPKYTSQLYKCVKTIEGNDNDIIPASIVLKMINLREINIKILIDKKEELFQLANRDFPFLYLVLSETFGKGNKNFYYIKFMENIDLFVREWKKNTYQPRKIKLYEDISELSEEESDDREIEENFFSSPPSSLLDKVLIIERVNEEDIDYDNDNGIRFIYDRGVVHLYRNNVDNIKVRKIMLNLIDFLDKNNSLSGLEVFAQFINVSGATEETVQKYLDFFGYDLNGLKTIGISFQVQQDSSVWVSILADKNQINQIYFIPTTSLFLIKKGISISKINVIRFEMGIYGVLQNLAFVNNNITHFELPVGLESGQNFIPLVIQRFPNIKVIGVRIVGIKRQYRINQIINLSTTYPQYQFVVFIGKDPPEPKLLNIEYRSISLDYNIDNL